MSMQLLGLLANPQTDTINLGWFPPTATGIHNLSTLVGGLLVFVCWKQKPRILNTLGQCTIIIIWNLILWTVYRVATEADINGLAIDHYSIIIEYYIQDTETNQKAMIFKKRNMTYYLTINSLNSNCSRIQLQRERYVTRRPVLNVKWWRHLSMVCKLDLDRRRVWITNLECRLY